MISLRAAARLATAALLLTAACSRTFVVPENQRTLAIAAFTDLLSTYNQGQCRSIYDAADDSFRAQPSHLWDEQCQQLRDNFGTWQNFRADSTTACAKAKEFVCVLGIASFNSGDHRIEGMFRIAPTGARLVWLSLQERGNEWIRIPHLRIPPLVDPPPAGSHNYASFAVNNHSRTPAGAGPVLSTSIRTSAPLRKCTISRVLPSKYATVNENKGS
jgi:hypothetical protein